jgi:signal transduction histidine kinase
LHGRVAGELKGPGLSLLAAFAAVVLSFGSATVYWQYRAAAIDAPTGAIAHDASPAIEHLAAARAELHHLRVLANDEIAAPVLERAELQEQLAHAEADLDAQLAAYRVLPSPPGELVLRPGVERELASVESAIADVTEAANAGDLDRAKALANGRLRRATERASAALLRAIDFNAARARDLALRIEDIRTQSSRVAWVLNILCGVFSLLAGTLAWRAMRRQAQLVAAHVRLTEGRAEELEAFAGRVAHDIVNPLGTAMLGVDIAQRLAAKDSRAQDALVRARRSLVRTNHLVAGLLEFARAGARPAPGARSDVAAVLQELAQEIQPAAAEAGVQLTFEPLPACATAATSSCLTSLAANLIRNAIKYIGEGPVRSVTVRCATRGQRVRIEVEDTGPGLPPGFGLAAFEPYVRGPDTGKPGIGLGLATVKRIAEAHGGSVGVRSAPGRGCLFWFELPAAAPLPSAEPAPAGAPAEEPALH